MTAACQRLKILVVDDEADGLPLATDSYLWGTTAVGATGSMNRDLQFVLPYLRATEHTAGVGTETEGALDARINFKWRFYEEDTFSLALMPGVIIPTGKSGLSTERVNPGVMLIGSYEPEPLALHPDIGYRYLDNVLGLREDLYHASVSVHNTLQDRLKMVADQSWESTLDPGPTGTVRYTTLGAIWRASQSFGDGCGVKNGHGEFAIDRTYLCGFRLLYESSGSRTC